MCGVRNHHHQENPMTNETEIEPLHLESPGAGIVRGGSREPGGKAGIR